MIIIHAEDSEIRDNPQMTYNKMNCGRCYVRVEIVSAFEHDSLKTCVLLYVHIMIYTNYIINTFMYHKLIKIKSL